MITGRSAEEWRAGGPIDAPETSSRENVPCDLPAFASLPTKQDTPAAKTEPVKPWGVEIVGGTTPQNALARYREWQPRFAGLVGSREPHVVIRGIIGQAGAARIRVGEDTCEAASKLCAALRAAGTYCDVMRN